MAVRKAPYRWRSDAFQKPMIGDRLEMYCPPVCAEDAFMHHLAERGMGEDGVHELLLGGFELAGDDIALDQLRHFRADHMRAEQFAGRLVEHRLAEALGLAQRDRLAVADEGELTDLHLPATGRASCREREWQ